MVGVLRSKRCLRCKRSKIKCDENWPTCTPCVRAKVTCSGPQNLNNFVNNHTRFSTASRSNKNGVTSQLSTPKISIISLESIRHRQLPGGSSFGHFRLSSDEPRRNPTTVADRVASRLVNYLAHEDAPWDILASISYNRYLPARLGESAALRDTVALMCSTWANFRRNLPMAQLVDSRLYGKALRSLQRALVDGRQQLSCETLAATAILERLEIVFDAHRPYNGSHHGLGIQSLMMRRGPPNLQDDLDIHLTYETHAALVSHWLVEGGENFYLSSPWKEAIEKGRLAIQRSVSGERMNCYAIGYYFGYWPDLSHELRRISNDPNSESMRARALALQGRATALEAEIKGFGEPIIRRARDVGRILEKSDPESPIGMKIHFSSLDTMSFFISYIMIRTLLNRIRHHLVLLLEQSDTVLDIEYRDLIEKIWMCIPIIKRLGMIPSFFFTSQLFLSYEGANEVEREYLLETIIEMASYRGRLPKDRRAIEILALDGAKAMTGRSGFDKSIATGLATDRREADQ